MATLADIEKKVRRITRSPSTSQLSDADLLQYINDFLLYDFPENLRLFTFRTTLSFYTQPNVDVYDTNTINADDPLYNFKNAYITTHDPVYIQGYKTYFTQSRNDFFNMFPAIQSRIQIGTGDGVTGLYTGTLSITPVLQNSVMFTSVDANNYGVTLQDVPRIDGATGLPTAIGDLIIPNTLFSHGTINYLTGVYTLTFPYIPAARVPIYAQVVGYATARPMSMLYFDNKFTLRPVPDISYEVKVETYIRPTELINAGDYPMLEQHWQYIAWGAARKIFEDRMDIESIQSIMPMFKEQELLVQRRTIVQQSNERVSTIYVQMVDPSSRGWGWNNYL